MLNFFRNLGAALILVIVAATCSNPVVSSDPGTVLEKPSSLELGANLPLGIDPAIISAFVAQILASDGTVILPINDEMPFRFTGLVAGTFTAQVRALLPDGADYFGKSQILQINGNASATLELLPTRALPVEFTPDEATVAPSTQLRLQSATPSALIRYTLDGSQPDLNSLVYIGPINLPAAGTQTIKARAYADNLEPSGIRSRTFTIDANVVAAPVFSPDQEAFGANVQVTLSSATSGATIFYSLDGSAPSVTYSDGITLTATTTIRAKATKSGMLDSPIVEKTYTKGLTSPNPPVFSHDTQTFSAPFTLVLSAAPGVRIYYTIDGSDPGLSGVAYSAPIHISTTTTVKAQSRLAGVPPSAVVIKVFTHDPNNTASNPPSISPASGTYPVGQKITLSATPGATIFYTLNGTEPNERSTPYTGPISLDSPAIITVRARAKEGSRPLSATVSETYNIQGSDTLRIHFYRASGTPTIWMWEEGGRAIMAQEGFSWPGPNMTPSGNGWFYFEIPSSYYPLTRNLRFRFDSGPEITLHAPVTASWWRKNNQWFSSNPDGPSVSATPGTTTFHTDSVRVTLSANGTTSSEFRINSGPWSPYINGQSIYLGAGLAAGESVTLEVRGNGGTLTGGPYVYTKEQAGDSITLYFKKSGATAPTVWYWERNGGRALAQVAGFAWPGPTMTSVGGGWWKYDIPTSLLPIVQPIGVIFDRGAELTRNPPVTGWWNGNAWSDENPDPPTPPSIAVTPPAGWYEGANVTVTPVITSDARAPLTSTRYRINAGAWVPYTSGSLKVTLGTTVGDTTELSMEATNSAGTTTAVFKYRTGPQPVPDFSWDNATIYFVITDRFYNGNPTNDSSFGRPRVDAGGRNIGTFHGGDIAGLTTKLNSGYFTALGVDALWITAPWEQAHGWVGGGEGGDFAHFAYHGYYALDFTNMDPNMGTRAEFKTFVDTARAQGIRILLDVVMNHPGYATIRDMETFNFGGRRFNFNVNWTPSGGQTWHSVHDAIIDYSPGTATAWSRFWGTDWIRAGLPGFTPGGGDVLTRNLANLPDFKTESTRLVGLPRHLVGKTTYGGAFADGFTSAGTRRVRDWLVAWIAQWVREFGIDGFRVDTAKHVEMESWHALRTASQNALRGWRAANPGVPGANWEDDFWMVAEVWGHGPNQSIYHTAQGGAFDSVINFGFQNVAGKGGSGPGPASGWEGTYAGYANAVNSAGSGDWNFLSYISSHDTGSTFRAGMSDTQQRRAGTLLLLAPGGVQIFYGDEYGRANGPPNSDDDQPSRSSMNWADANAQAASSSSILSHWRRVGQFRERNLAVGAGTHQSITANGAPYAFVRQWGTGNKVAVAVDATATSVTFTLPSGFWPNGTQVRDAYSGNTATVNANSVTITGVTVGNPVLVEKRMP